MYQDYTNVRQDSPYIRYVNRWHLEKQNPQLTLSEPIKPIVYWIENTVPYELRDAVREGILAWNQAFAAAGFKNALIVKQMPDDANWDPADVRYNTVRWMFQPGSGYAVVHLEPIHLPVNYMMLIYVSVLILSGASIGHIQNLLPQLLGQ